MTRILVTGSRDWDDPEFVDDLICDYWRWHESALVVVRGDCPTGADAHAGQAVIRLQGEGFDATEEVYKAYWEQYGKRAGFLRNKEMVDDGGAEVCLAFIRNGSRGATMTADLAEKSGIPTVRFERWSPHIRPGLKYVPGGTVTFE